MEEDGGLASLKKAEQRREHRTSNRSDESFVVGGALHDAGILRLQENSPRIMNLLWSA